MIEIRRRIFFFNLHPGRRQELICVVQLSAAPKFIQDPEGCPQSVAIQIFHVMEVDKAGNLKACQGILDGKSPHVRERFLCMGDHFRQRGLSPLVIEELCSAQIPQYFFPSSERRVNILLSHHTFRPWHCLYFFPDPQGHGSFRPTFMILRSPYCPMVAKVSIEE